MYIDESPSCIWFVHPRRGACLCGLRGLSVDSRAVGIVAVGGAPVSRVGQVSIALFFVSIAATAVADAVWPILFGLVAWAVGYWAQYRDSKRYVHMLANKRAENALKFPELLVEPPASSSAEELPERESFRAFNNLTGEFLGELNREQLQFLIRWHEQHELVDEVKNDFYILEEAVEQMSIDGADPGLTEMLRKATAATDSVFLRWA